MPSVQKAHNELYRRKPDEVFPTFMALLTHCERVRATSQTYWLEPYRVRPQADDLRMVLELDEEPFNLNDWSFGQLCRQADVQKDTVNRLSPETACRVLVETLPAGNKPQQIYVAEKTVAAIHGVNYTRMFNAEVLSVVAEWATNFRPPQEAENGGTGLYCGEQDMFCFLIDPTGWIEIGKEAFAPGFFLWNSEVGRRTVGIQSFWFQAVCQNHIVWGMTDVTEFSRKHTSNVREALDQIRGIIENLIERRNQNRDDFVRIVRQAMKHTLNGEDDAVLRVLLDHGFNQALAKASLELAQREGRLTVFSLVDALTRISQERCKNGGDRAELDQKAGRLLSLVA